MSREYELFKLTADTHINRKILEKARVALNKIKENKDMLHGIHIVLSDSTKYEDFIRALNYCDEKFPGAFAPYNNNIWAYYIKIDTTDIPKPALERWRKKYGKL